MSKPIAGKPRPSPEAVNPTPPTPRVEPPRARRKLLFVLGIVYACWIALLLVLYFTTVYPKRHPSPPAATQSTAMAVPTTRTV